MARIVLTGNLQLHTEGVSELELDVNTIRQLMRQLTTRYPGLPAQRGSGVHRWHYLSG